MLDAWGWRIAFLLGAAIVPFGLALRRRLEETLPAEAAQPAPPGSLRPFLIVAAAGMLILGAATISNYTLSYLTTYAQDTLRMAVPAAFGATVVLGLVSVAGDLASGWLADRYGRKRVLVLPWLALIAAGGARPSRSSAWCARRRPCSARPPCCRCSTSSARPRRCCSSSRRCRRGSAPARSA